MARPAIGATAAASPGIETTACSPRCAVSDFAVFHSAGAGSLAGRADRVPVSMSVVAMRAVRLGAAAELAIEVQPLVGRT